MRLRFWIGLAAVTLVAAGAIAAAALVFADARGDFERRQQGLATRAAEQAESLVGLSVGQLASGAAFFQADGNVDQREFEVIGHSLLDQGMLAGAVYVPRITDSERAGFERRHGFAITERTSGGSLRPAARRPVYYPVAYVAARGDASRALGYDLGSDPMRRPYLAKARDTGRSAATPVIPLVLGSIGFNVYHPIYRGASMPATEAARRRSLVGFAAGAIRVDDLTASVQTALPAGTESRLRADRGLVFGGDGALDDPATAPIGVADRAWVLVVRDPDRPGIVLPLLLAAVGLSIAALLGALIVIWSRNERMLELQREAGEDPLTGLKNRRLFEEELRTAIARARRDGASGAMLMLDLDDFKRVNDTWGHPAGDRLLREIAGLLNARVRGGDVLARLGGDEFAIVLPRCGATEARVVAEAITTAIREHQPDGEVEPVTASVGVATFGTDPQVGATAVVSRADAAMYAAKADGRDSVRVFDPAAVAAD